jgi:hypothetical protein
MVAVLTRLLAARYRRLGRGSNLGLGNRFTLAYIHGIKEVDNLGSKHVVFAMIRYFLMNVIHYAGHQAIQQSAIIALHSLNPRPLR